MCHWPTRLSTLNRARESRLESASKMLREVSTMHFGFVPTNNHFVAQTAFSDHSCAHKKWTEDLCCVVTLKVVIRRNNSE